MKCRLIESGFNSCSWNMAADESVLESVASGSQEPTLRLYGWKPAAVSIGYFQGMSEEVDLKACEQMNVECVRRMTGGGAVFHEHEITYSIILPEDTVPEDILESYRKICKAIILGLDHLGIESEFAPLNDIITCGRKISGNAQTRRMKCMLQHGTILLKVDVEKMFSLLKVPNEKIRDKLIKNVKDRVTSVEDVTGKDIGLDGAAPAFRKGFSEALDLELTASDMDAGELDRTEELIRQKYGQESWNNRR
ncbi:biotin/lipoate A/B protein ligase family protein [Candidatus Altiarchaeota archaeon]